MRVPSPLLPVLIAALAVLAGCAAPDDGAYPRLLPLSDLAAPPAIPDHAADAAADPGAVGDALSARRAATRTRADAARRPVADADALATRAAALRRRADALARDPDLGDPGLGDPAQARDALPPCPPETTDAAAAGCPPGPALP